KFLVSQPDHDFCKGLVSVCLGCESPKGPDSRPFRIQLVDVQRDREILHQVDLMHNVDAIAEALDAQDVFIHLSSRMPSSHEGPYHFARFESGSKKSVSVAD